MTKTLPTSSTTPSRLKLFGLLLWLSFVLASGLQADDQQEPFPDRTAPPYGDLSVIPEIQDFLATAGSAPHPAAPAEIAQFGRLVGIWDTRQEVRKQDGTWVEGAPALWIWKYALDGFATQDLWFHTEDQLPAYLGDLGRPYMLTALRVFDADAAAWHVAWAANGGSQVAGPDFGTLTAVSEPVPDADGTAEDRMVLTGTSEYGRQRITFHHIRPDSFAWTSEYSPDGTTWMEIMRVSARRRH